MHHILMTYAYAVYAQRDIPDNALHIAVLRAGLCAGLLATG